MRVRTSLKERGVPTRGCAVRRLAKQLSWRRQRRANINTLLGFAGLDQEHTGRVQSNRQAGRQADRRTEMQPCAPHSFFRTRRVGRGDISVVISPES